MSNGQGFYGALCQYWSIEPKARLHRRNTYFDDHKASNSDALKFAMVVSTMATAVIIFWSLIGVML